jgi:hypothetical protein
MRGASTARVTVDLSLEYFYFVDCRSQGMIIGNRFPIAEELGLLVPDIVGLVERHINKRTVGRQNKKALIRPECD